ncbi:MAG: sec-independent translocase [Nocardioidaceae bacterium]|nr:sec-independent translocase [Nocardioidaceae bacterium]
MFDIGFGELAVIAVLAVLVFGPDKLPGLAQQAGKFVRQLRQFANTARDELRSELGPEYADLELTDLDPRAVVRKHIAEAMAELDELEATVRDAGSGALGDAEELPPLAEGELPPYDADAT